jgi:Asp/Glu/hydantoin racemase
LAIEGQVQAPVLDGVTCGVQLCETLARQNKTGPALTPRVASPQA